MKHAAFFLLLVMLWTGAASAAQRPVVVVPLDDRPVTRQLPVMLGAVAGIPVLTPPHAMLGNYLQPGDPQALMRWLRSDATAGAGAFVLSTDMLVYGGLVASRVPGIPAFLGYARLRDVVALRDLHPGAPFYAFGTVMRLAPTGLPAIGPAAAFFAAGEDVDELTDYANLPDPPLTLEDRVAAHVLRKELGPVLDQYLATRRRNLDVDLFALQLTAEGGFDRLVLGQDDAGPQGLHLADLAALRAAQRRFQISGRTSIEPGADELAMVLEAAAFAGRIGWTPRVGVVWSRPDAPSLNDPLEYAPLENTVDSIVRATGSVPDDVQPEIALFVRAAGTTPEQDRAFVRAIEEALRRGRLVTVADVSFLGGGLADQRALTQELIAERIAGRLAGFASWNTAANTVGTALAAAIAAGVGRRQGTFSQTALAQFLLDRYADDYAFHQFVRPALNAALEAADVDHEYLLPDVAQRVANENRSLLWPDALNLLTSIFPEYRDAGLTITLPWDRTFETELDVRLRPR